MKHSIYRLPLFAVFATLAACGVNHSTESDVGSVTSRQEQTVQKWQIEYSVSGGIAGLQRQLTISSNGEFSASDRKLGHTGGSLGAERLAQLNKTLVALENSPPQHNSPVFPGRCADCIESSVSVLIDGKRYLAKSRGGNNPAQPYADLFAQLSTLLQETFSQQ